MMRSDPAPHMTPQPGDVVIWSDSSGHVVSIHPDRQFIKFGVLAEALSLANRWAEHKRVRVWRTRDGVTFTQGEVDWR